MGKLHGTKIGMEISLRNFDFPFVFFLHYASNHLTNNRRQLAFEVTNPRFTSVSSDNVFDSIIFKSYIAFFESMLFDLLGYKIALCDMQLFNFGITGEFDNLHAITKCRRNGIKHICCSDEHNIRQIKRNFKIMI